MGRRNNRFHTVLFCVFHAFKNIYNHPQIEKLLFLKRDEQIRFHYETLIKIYGEKYVVKFMRAHLAGYLSGEYKNSELLVKLLKMEKYSEILTNLQDFLGKK